MKNDNFELILNRLVKACQIALMVVIGALALSGFRIIRSDEVALVLRFGKPVGQTRESQIHHAGLLMAFPSIIDQVVRVPLGVLELPVNAFETQGPVTDSIRQTGYLLTGDGSVMNLSATVKFKISDPVDFALANSDPLQNLQNIVSWAINRAATSHSLDQLLTVDQTKFVEQVTQLTKNELVHQNLGLTVLSIELNHIRPPQELKAAFDQVNDATVAKETAIKTAKQYEEELIPQATAESDRLVSDAQMLAADQIGIAQKDVAEINGLSDEYALHPQLTKARLWRQKVGSAFRQIGNTYVVPNHTPHLLAP